MGFSRREALSLGLVAVGSAFAGCSSAPRPPEPTRRPALPKTTPQAQAEKRGSFEVTEQDIQNAARRAIETYSQELSLPLSPDQILPHIVFVQNLKEYQNIIASSETDYKPTDELDRPGVTTDKDSSYGKKMFFYKASLEDTTRKQPRLSKETILEYLITHELVHWLAKDYASDEMHQLIFGKMFADIPEFKGKKVEKDYVSGARIESYVEGVRKSGFKNLDETEAYTIGNYARRKKGLVSNIDAPTRSMALFDNLLRRLGPSYEFGIKTVARLRNEEFGREKLARIIGEIAGVASENRLFFGMSVFYMIDTGNETGYNRLMNRLTPT